MRRDEIIKLLEVLSTTYPYAKISDAGLMATAWEMTLGDYSAESVFKAVRLHMETNRFFPAPADIRDLIVRADIVYSQPIQNNLLESKSDNSELVFVDGLYYRRDEWEAYAEAEAEAISKFVGFGCNEQDDVAFPLKPNPVSSGFLAFEL